MHKMEEYEYDSTAQYYLYTIFSNNKNDMKVILASTCFRVQNKAKVIINTHSHTQKRASNEHKITKGQGVVYGLSYKNID